MKKNSVLYKIDKWLNCCW